MYVMTTTKHVATMDIKCFRQKIRRVIATKAKLTSAYVDGFCCAPALIANCGAIKSDLIVLTGNDSEGSVAKILNVGDRREEALQWHAIWEWFIHRLMRHGEEGGPCHEVLMAFSNNQHSTKSRTTSITNKEEPTPRHSLVKEGRSRRPLLGAVEGFTWLPQPRILFQAQENEITVSRCARSHFEHPRLEW